ncbi:hypothetical protein ABKN59_000784 [Abortiporus biennis]
MPSLGKKRLLDDASANPKAKKTKVDNISKKLQPDISVKATSSLLQEDVDFPRGGGTLFTPLEVKTIRAEARKEADEELFEDKNVKHVKRHRRKSEAKVGEKSKGNKDYIRVEHLNYKRISVGMKMFGQIISVLPLALIVSLPNQLLAHIPITSISSELTSRLESMDEDVDMDSEDDEDDESDSSIPDLSDLFRPGQYIRAVITAVHAQGITDGSGMVRGRDELQKASRRVEMSLVPEKVNEGIAKADLKKGFSLSASVKSIEDHGYILNFGVPEVSGFLSFKDADSSLGLKNQKLQVGSLLDTCISKVSTNGRTFTVTVDPAVIRSASISEVTNVTSILPGSLVQCLITAVLPTGLNLQVVGFFQGTIELLHLAPGDLDDNYKVGQKVKARILYDISPSNPPRFGLSLLDHVVSLSSKACSPSDNDAGTLLQDAYPIGTILDSVKVIRVESERGLVVEISSGIEGFVHISQVSDDHVPSLSSTSGPWKVGTYHRARVLGYYPLDGLLQLSMKPSVLEQRFLQVGEVQVGEIVKGTIKKLTDSALFVSISGNVDAVIWPNHYADIQLKHPQKRFKPGASIKCRILVVDPVRKRIVCTAKRTLIDSDLPVVAKLDDAKVGLVTHAVVFKASDKSLQVEFYNNLKAIVSIREISDTAVGSLPDSFPAGKVVQVRIISVDTDNGRIVASIRQGAPNYKSAIMDISDVEIGNLVEGVISEVQKDKIMLTLQPSQVRALLSINNLANRRGMAVAQLRASLKVGEKLQDLVVTIRNPEKGFVLVATKPKERPVIDQKGLNIGTVQPGQHLQGRVLKHIRQGALLKVSSHINGILHPTDTCDDYEAGQPFPSQGTVLEAVVISVDKDKKQLVLSTRLSRLKPGQVSEVTDKEIRSLDDLKVGSTVRGFIKTVAEHGLFVTIGRNIDARVQIKELFDDFVKDWKSRFTANQLVKGRVVSVDTEKNQVEMTFRSSEPQKDAETVISLSDLSPGDKVDGIVKKIEDYGLFIEVAGSKVRGLCHKSEISDNKDADVVMALRSFRQGDRVRAKILSIDTEKRRISFGLKPSYFDEGDFSPEQESQQQDSDNDGEDDSDEEPDSLGVVGGENGAPKADDDHEASSDENDSDGENDEVMVDLESLLPQITAKDTGESRTKLSNALKLDAGFQWSVEGNQEKDTSSDSSDDDEGQIMKKKKRKHKEIEQDLTADMHNKSPESNADFERLLLGSPNSSYLWIQYMSFQLQLSEIEKAKEIAKRALKTISFREEQEKLNVWIALLNLENVYGTDDSFEATFRDAARHNDAKTIYLRLASIFDQSDKPEKAEEQFKRTAKKFGQSSKVWTLFGEHYLKRSKLEEARSLLPRSLQSLEKRKHLKTICKFAQLEYKFGDPERGRTIFEGIVDSHPKRWDLWSIYLDMEAGQSDIATLRNLFDRLFALKMTSHKAKSFFKKWLEIERRLGDEEGVELVKTKAIEWTQRAANIITS